MNILWLSDSPLTTTGYSTISWNVCNRLTERGHNVHYIGHNYLGQDIPPGLTLKDGTRYNFWLMGGSPKPYAQDLIMPYIKKYKIDVVVVLLDTFMCYPWIMNIDFAPAKTIFYFPSDGGGGMPLGCENILKKVNLPIAMAKFGQRQVKELYDIDTKYIPHAVNIKDFYPLTADEKEKCKLKYNLQGKFVVGCVQRNQGRKMPDRLLKAFKIFSKDKPDAMLFLHTDPFDMAAPFNMVEIINRYKLNNRVVFTGMCFHNSFDYKQMNEVYNTMDIFAMSTSGEGFGIPIIEAQACEIPPVITNYTTSQELIKDNGESGLVVDLVGTEEEETPLIHSDQVIDGTLTGSWNVERGICSIKDLANKMEILYKDKKLREQLGKNGRKKVTEFYNWDKVGKEWIDTIEELVK